MKRLVFIANGRSGTGGAEQRVTELYRSVSAALPEHHCEMRLSTSLADMTSWLRSLEPEAHQAVFVAGGDGTINRALPELSRTRVPLGIVPCGTANDLAREVGALHDRAAVLRMVASGATQEIDLIRVNDVLFATVGGLGVGAALCEEFNRRRASSGLFRWLCTPLKWQVYTALTIKAILGPARRYTHRVRVRSPALPGGEGVFDAAGIFICNQSSLGGDLTVATGARNDDGVFEVLLVPHGSRPSLMRALLQLKRGTVPRNAIRFACDELTIEELDGRPMPMFGDGEILVASPKLEFRIVPRALVVYRNGSTPE